MLEGIAHQLPAGDQRVPVLLQTAARHRDVALPAVTGEFYEGGHWWDVCRLFDQRRWTALTTLEVQ